MRSNPARCLRRGLWPVLFLTLFLTTLPLRASTTTKSTTEGQGVAPAFEQAIASRPEASARRVGAALLARLDAQAWKQQDCFGQQAWVPASVGERIARLEAALEPFPDSPERWARLGRLHEAEGDETRAEKAWLEHLRHAPDKGEALEELSAFYGRRLRWREAAAALDRAASLADGEKRRSRLSSLIDMLERQALRSIDRVEVLRRLVEASPADAAPALRRVDALKEGGRFDEALEAARDYALRYPDRWTVFQERRSDWLFQAKRVDEALALHWAHLDRLAEPDDRFRYSLRAHLDLLVKAKRYRARRRSLMARARTGNLSERELVLLVGMGLRDGRGDETEQLVRRWVELRKKGEAARLGGLLMAELGRHVAAQRLLLSATVEADPQGKDDLRWEIFRLMGEHPDGSYPLTGTRMRDWIDGTELDGNPGAVTGVLSLAFNEIDFVQQGKTLDGASRIFFNHAYMAELAEAHGRDFPDSPHRDAMDRRLFDILRQYQAWPQAVALGEKLAGREADPARAFELRLDMASCWLKAKKVDGALAVFDALLRSPLAEDDGRRQRVFDRYVRALIEEKRHMDALALHRAELDRRPDDPKAYDRFLRFATRHQMVAEELAIYERAIRRFTDKTWFQRLARWSIRRKKAERFRQLVEKVKETFSASDLGDFLGEFIRYRWKQESHPDSRYYLELYRFALARFPTELRFARGLERYHEHFAQTRELEALRLRYAFRDRAMRKALLTEWSRTGTLGRHLAQAEQHWKDDPEDVAYGMLAVEGALFRCQPEEALDLLRSLVTRRPSCRDLLETKAKLARSLGRCNEALETWARLRDEDPEQDDHVIEPGECLIEARRHGEAMKLWRSLLRRDAGREARCIEVATLFWDYYLFDEALAVLREGRTRLGRPSAFRKAIGAIHESRSDWPSAVAEYVAILLEDDPYDWTARERLVHLADRRGQDEDIRKAFGHALVERPGEASVIRAYAAFLNERDDAAAIEKLYGSSLPRCEELELLDEMANFFEGRGLPERRGSCLHRAAEIAEWQGEAVRRWAGWLEERGRFDEAVAVWRRESESLESDREDEPERLARQLESESAFLWRIDRREDSLKRLDASLKLARGERLQRGQALLARRLIETGQDAKARSLLGELLEKDPFNLPCFSALMQLQVRARDVAGLRKLVHEKIRQIRKAPMKPLERRNQIVRLRLDLAGEFEKLAARREAVDEMIEVINAEPPAPSATRKAWQLVTEDEGLRRHLFQYYEATAAKSNRDHRWPLVLATLHELAGELPEAVKAMEAAIRIVPQRVDLRRGHVDLLERLGRFDEAALALRALHGIDGDSAWLLRIGDALARAGKIDDAVKVVDETLVGRPVPASRHLDAALRFWNWDRKERALEQVRKTQNRWKDRFLDDTIPFEGLKDSLRILALGRGFDAALEAQQQLVDFAGYVSGEAKTYWARSRVQGNRRTIERVGNEALAPLLAETGRDRDRQAVRKAMLTWIDGAPEIPRAVFDRHLAFARAARMPGLEEALLRKALDGGMRITGSIWTTRQRRLALAEFMDRHQRWEDRAALLKVSAKATGQVGEFRSDLAALIAVRRLQGEPAKELEELRWLWTELAEGGKRPWDAQRRRYYELLLASERFETLEGLTREPDLLFANVAIERGHWRLAEANLQTAYGTKSPLWHDSRLALLKAGAGDSLQEVRPLFERALGLSTVGEAVDSKPDPTRVAIGTPWFALSAAYGEYLGKAKASREARRFLTALVEARPRDPQAWLLFVEGLVKAGRCDEAVGACTRALGLWPRDLRLIEALARAELARGKKTEALEAWKRLLWTAGDRACLHRYVRALREGAFASEARKALEDSIMSTLAVASRRFLSEDLKLLFQDRPEGDLAFLEKLHEKASTRLDLVELVLDDGWVRGAAQRRWLGRALALVKQRGRPALLEAWEDRLARVCKTDQAWAELAELARSVLRRLDDLVPAHRRGQWQSRLALASMKLGDEKGAAQAMTRIREVLGVPEARRLLISLLGEAGREDEAWALRVEEARERLRGGDRDESLLVLAREALHRKAFAEAVDFFSRRARQSTSSQAWLDGAEALMAAAAAKESLSFYDRYLQLEAQADEIRRTKGLALAAAGRKDEALKEWIALWIRPSTAAFLRMALVDDLAHVAGESGLGGPLEALVRLDGSASPEDRFLAGRLLVAAGRRKEGLSQLESAATSALCPVESLAWLARLRFEDGATEEAMAFARRAWQLRPEDPQLAAFLIRTWLGGGKASLAAACLSPWRSLGRRGRFRDAFRGRLIPYGSWTELEGALALWSHGGKLGSFFLDAARAAREAGLDEEARDFLDRAASLCEGDSDGALAKAVALERQRLHAPPVPGPELVLTEGGLIR